MTLRSLLVLAIGVAAVAVATPSCAPDDPGPSGPRVIRAPQTLNEPPAPADWQTLVDLRGMWAFRIGGDSTWNDGKEWDRIPVPAAWENAGYHGYDGTAWYRTTFELDAEAASLAEKESAHLLLGRIDDVDEVWLNGERVGATGRPPPDYQTAAFGFRVYRVPPALLRADRPNVLTVRVYDAGLEAMGPGPPRTSTTAAGPPSACRATGSPRGSPGPTASGGTADTSPSRPARPRTASCSSSAPSTTSTKRSSTGSASGARATSTPHRSGATSG